MAPFFNSFLIYIYVVYVENNYAEIFIARVIIARFCEEIWEVTIK